MSAPVTQTMVVALQDRKVSVASSNILKMQNDQMRRFFELSADLFCIASFDGYFKVLNRAWEETLGFSREDLLEKPWHDFVPPDDLDSTIAEVERITTCGRHVSFENRFRCKNGSYKWLLWNAIAMPDQSLIYASARDITEGKQAEAARQHAQHELETSVQERAVESARNNAILLAEFTHCRRIEKSLGEAQEKYRSIFENAVEGIFQSTPEGVYISVNPALARIKGYDSPAELMRAIGDIGQQSYVDSNRRAELKSLMERNGVVNAFEYEVYRKDGKKIWLSMNARAVRNSDGAVAYYEGTVEDITERKQLEDQLRLAQKMEAVGRLAGGIAHDFNNLLGVMMGHGELLLERLEETSPLRKHAEQINGASASAASLVGQLLAFSRKQVLEPVVLDLNSVVKNVANMLERVIGENITLTSALDSELGRIKADRGQMEQIIINLVVNARDAMPSGGIIRIETANIRAEEGRSFPRSGESSDSLVGLTVTDTGIGMDQETQSHIFEPFFTTKVRGTGTGLGLATVYGVVKQAGGSIRVQSEPGHGATFKIVFPRVDEVEQRVGQETNSEPSYERSETILLVEDDTALRELVLAYLTKRGYTVLEAANGPQAHSVAKRFRGPIHLLLSDVVMPGVSGPRMADELTSLHPNMKELYMIP